MIAFPLSRHVTSRGSFCAVIPTIKTTSQDRSDGLRVRQRTSPGTGGYKFFADPAIQSGFNTVFWRPEDCARVVILARSTCENSDASIKWRDLSIAKSRTDSGNRLHILLNNASCDTQVLIENADEGGRYLRAIIPFDRMADRRLAATGDLWRLIRKKTITQQTGPDQMMERLCRALITLDALKANATHREIAEHFYGMDRIADEPWKTSSIRQTIIRLDRTGHGMLNGGYIKLLQR